MASHRHIFVRFFLLIMLAVVCMLSVVPVLLAQTTPSSASASATGCTPADDTPLLMPECPVRLLQPIDSNTTLPTGQDGVDTLIKFINRYWVWIVGTALGFAILQVVVGGIQIMFSGGGDQRAAGIERVKWAMLGVMLVMLSGFILRSINPFFFQ